MLYISDRKESRFSLTIVSALSSFDSSSFPKIVLPDSDTQMFHSVPRYIQPYISGLFTATVGQCLAVGLTYCKIVTHILFVFSICTEN